MRRSRFAWASTVVSVLRAGLVLAVLVVPLAAGGSWRFFSFQMVVSAYLAMSFNLAYSYGRILSFAQGLFFAVGAYVAFYTASHAPWSLPAALLGALVAGALLGAVLGAVLVRMDGHNPTIATVIIASVGLLAANALTSVTGGEDGLRLVTTSVGIGPFQLDVGSGYAMYYLASITLVTLVAASWLLRDSRLWKVMRAVAENDVRAQQLGFNVRLRRLVIFSVSAGIAALGGAFHVLLMQHVTSSVFDIGLSVNAILWAVVGGVGTAFGPLLGVFVVYPVTEIVASVFVYVQILIGLLLVVVAVFFPRGILGTLLEIASANKEKATHEATGVVAKTGVESYARR